MPLACSRGGHTVSKYFQYQLSKESDGTRKFPDRGALMQNQLEHLMLMGKFGGTGSTNFLHPHKCDPGEICIFTIANSKFHDSDYYTFIQIF